MQASAGGHGLSGLLSAMQETPASSQQPYTLKQMITAVRPCGIASVPGVYGGLVPVNMGSAVQKGPTVQCGQTHVKRRLEPLTKLIENGKIDPGFLIARRKTFRDKRDGRIETVFNLS